MTRILALDVGDKRIGVALSDELGIAAHPLVTLTRHPGYKTDLRAIAEIVEESRISKIIIGVPINMNGSEGEQAMKAREFAEKLRRSLKTPVETWDERLTTVQAKKTLAEGNASRTKRKTAVDQLAAALILESYLAAKGGGKL